MIETIASNAFPCAHPVVQRVAPSIPLHFVLETFKGGIKPWLAPSGTTFEPAFNLLNTEHFVVLGAAAGRRDTVFSLTPVQIHRLTFMAEQVHRRGAIELQGIPGNPGIRRQNPAEIDRK